MHAQALNETYPQPEHTAGPDRELPVLRLIQGDGEDPGGSVAPELHVVPDAGPAPDMEPEAPAATEPAPVEQDGSVAVLQAKRQQTARRAGGKAVAESAVWTGNKVATVTPINSLERRKKSGGGRWLLEQHRKKLEAEAKERAEAESLSHPDGCSCTPCARRR